MTIDMGIQEDVFFFSFFFSDFSFACLFPLALLEMKIWLSVGLN